MIAMTDLGQQYNEIKDEIAKAVEKVFAEGKYILGPEVAELEERLASYCGARYGIGVASGTDAIVLSVVAAGIGEGDEVITTPFTFIATIEAVIRAGAKPVFADIDPKTYNIDPSAIESKITAKTKAVIPVHLYGLPCDMTAIMEIAKKHNLTVIEDCAQSFGAAVGGKITGSFGDFGCFSFFPAKNLGCYGDGGMIITDNKDYAKKLKLLRMHGFSSDYDYRLHGFNSRLDTIQAAIVNVKMNHIDGWIDKRRENAVLYEEGLKDVKELEPP
ncbi:MAG: DegT/DnrJ/EryC1/StrS family aminotransferase, partial [Elusimicrobiota bacterium]|nr:DegT/DnrJ/EryC1/StrS family aminotransferase [Elusimicrobiota bacterium]